MRRLTGCLVTAAALWPAAALAELPKNNVPGEFWHDQWVAADRYWLPPHLWGIFFAVVAVLATVAFVWRGWGRPSSDVPENPAEPDARTHRRRLWFVVLGFMALYAVGFAGSFSIYDDPQNIWLDSTVNHLSWVNTKKILFHNYRGVNQEGMFLSLQLSYAAFGRIYAGFFAFNWLMLGVLLLLMHRFAYLLSRSRPIALLSVVFFGLSPIVVELISWMLERGHLIGLTFTLLSCIAYLSYLDRRESGRARWVYFAGALLAYAGSQFGKPIFIYVPLWFVLFDVWVRRRDWLQAFAEKMPFLLVLGLFLYKIVRAGADHHRVNHAFIGGSFSNTLALDANHTLEYLRFAFFPTESGLHTPWNEPANWWHVTGIPDILIHGFPPVASLIILLCLGVVGVVLATRYRWGYLLLALVGGVISVGAVMNVPTTTIVHAYRYTLAMNVLASVCLAAATYHVMAPGRLLAARKHVAVGLAGVMLGLGAAHTTANLLAWRTPLNLWSRNAEVLYPHDGWSHYYGGKAFQLYRRYHEAVTHQHLAYKYLPTNEMIERRLGDDYYALHDNRHAGIHWRRYFRHNRGKIKGGYVRKLQEVGLEDLIPARVLRQAEREPSATEATAAPVRQPPHRPGRLMPDPADPTADKPPGGRAGTPQRP